MRSPDGASTSPRMGSSGGPSSTQTFSWRGGFTSRPCPPPGRLATGYHPVLVGRGRLAAVPWRADSSVHGQPRPPCGDGQTAGPGCRTQRDVRCTRGSGGRRRAARRPARAGGDGKEQPARRRGRRGRRARAYRAVRPRLGTGAGASTRPCPPALRVAAAFADRRGARAGALGGSRAGESAARPRIGAPCPLRCGVIRSVLAVGERQRRAAVGAAYRRRALVRRAVACVPGLPVAPTRRCGRRAARRDPRRRPGRPRRGRRGHRRGSGRDASAAGPPV